MRLFRTLSLASLAVVFPLLTGCAPIPAPSPGGMTCVKGHDVCTQLDECLRVNFVCDEYAPIPPPAHDTTDFSPKP